ncbi:MAG: helix-turn-helix domain-containing protein [Candidatus Margulisbacteria bacterium]|nr:helix-turn-helix domain-containing protein [Candidatus Margulisiibacteriota bacterium]MBU1021598.1 helix-turn-helix domain-containing protein [Candidatus Margulisiibacteriota bacterium]MBU1728749.1 helix-turn-helix domain-containing protein [Candidatus Margulisiibacteriota bacterium]MBU1955715.1 helix-turn-helix domain-containing protein [Candidatus Margulisiibacteriota bacterium]
MSKLKGLKLKQISAAVKEGQPVAIEKVGQRLRDIRQALGMTQKQLAKRINISQPLLSRIEDNAASCTLKTIVRVANALGSEFLGVLASKDTLEAMIQKQAEKKAKSFVKRTFANMAMEQQAPGKKAYEYQLKKLTEELASNPVPALWEE